MNPTTSKQGLNAFPSIGKLCGNRFFVFDRVWICNCEGRVGQVSEWSGESCSVLVQPTGAMGVTLTVRNYSRLGRHMGHGLGPSQATACWTDERRLQESTGVAREGINQIIRKHIIFSSLVQVLYCSSSQLSCTQIPTSF